MTVEGLDRLAGTPLKGGTIRISAEENQTLTADVLQWPTESGALHPLYAYIAPQRGIGVSIAELCSLADFSVDDGPMLGSVELECSEDLLPDVDYRVEGEVVGLARKEGRALGTFDLFTYRERLIDPHGTVVATATNSFVLPRKKRP